MKNYQEVKEAAETLVVQMSTYQIITNEVESFDQEISDIKAQIASLEASSQQPVEVITADRSAYFVSYCDGYEEMLTPDILSALTADQVNSVSDTKLDDPTIVGKLVNGYEKAVCYRRYAQAEV